MIISEACPGILGVQDMMKSKAGCFGVCPLCLPLLLFIRGRHILFQISSGAYLEGQMPTLFWSLGAYAPYAPRLLTALDNRMIVPK